MNMVNVDAWLERHPTASVLTQHIIDDNGKHSYDGEYQTQLENWESQVTRMIWPRLRGQKSLKKIRKKLVLLAGSLIEGIEVKTAEPMLGYKRAFSVSFTYRGRYRRTQVFHLPS